MEQAGEVRLVANKLLQRLVVGKQALPAHTGDFLFHFFPVVLGPQGTHGVTYTFSVRATDVAGNSEPTVATHTITVDLEERTITNVRPSPGSTTTDLSPAIAATVSGDVVDLDKSRIRLFIDGLAAGTADRRQITGFAYDQATDRLTYVPPAGLGLGQQAVTVVATDPASNQKVRTWSFEIVR